MKGAARRLLLVGALVTLTAPALASGPPAPVASARPARPAPSAAVAASAAVAPSAAEERVASRRFEQRRLAMFLVLGVLSACILYRIVRR